ncbi:MAG: hypothetical protein IOC63_13050 [Methylobacterium sp.]|nr:hypothetical protein [Methylobacterium sp.]
MLDGRTPIALVGSSRQMWRSAHGRLRDRLTESGVCVVSDSMITQDGGGATLITTPLMLLTGERRGFGPLPAPRQKRAELEGVRHARAEVAARLSANALEGDSAWANPQSSHPVTPLEFRASEMLASRYMSLWTPIFRRFGSPGHPLRGVLCGLWAVIFLAAVATIVPALAAIGVAIRFVAPARTSAETEA